MLDRPNVEVTDRVALIVHRILSKRAVVGPIGHDDDLRAIGVSSLDLVNLMLCVEAEFAVKIPDREMTPANFRSVARIATLVRVLTQQPAA